MQRQQRQQKAEGVRVCQSRRTVAGVGQCSTRDRSHGRAATAQVQFQTASASASVTAAPTAQQDGRSPRHPRSSFDSTGVRRLSSHLSVRCWHLLTFSIQPSTSAMDGAIAAAATAATALATAATAAQAEEEAAAVSRVVERRAE